MGLQTGYSNSVSTDDATPVRGPFLCLVAAAGEMPIRPLNRA